MNKNKIYKSLFIVLPFILAIPAHFLYNFISFPLLAIYFPINESIFEHTKLTFTPIIITYLIFYMFFKKRINKTTFLSSLIIAITSSTTIMLILYYSFDFFLNKDITILNILSLLISTIASQLLSIHAYKKDIKWSKEISIYILLTITMISINFTVAPPYLDFFKDLSK